MIIINNCVLIGRLTRDPELRYLPNGGNSVCNFSLAIDKNLAKDKKQEMESKNQPTADFINIVVWGKTAENCANFLAKGRLVAVQGRLQNNNYKDKDGKKVYGMDIVAQNIEFLEFGSKNENSSSELQDFNPVDSSDIPF